MSVHNTTPKSCGVSKQPGKHLSCGVSKQPGKHLVDGEEIAL